MISSFTIYSLVPSPPMDNQHTLYSVKCTICVRTWNWKPSCSNIRIQPLQITLQSYMIKIYISTLFLHHMVYNKQPKSWKSQVHDYKSWASGFTKGILLFSRGLMHKISMHINSELSNDTVVKPQPDPKNMIRQGISFYLDFILSFPI